MARQTLLPKRSRSGSRTGLLGALLLCALVCSSARATIYFYLDAEGVSHFSDRNDDPRYRPYINDASAPAEATAVGQLNGTQRYIAPRYLREVSDAARSNGVDPALLHAVIAVESGYNPRAVSPKGALGLMQLMPETARQFHVADPMNPAQNIQGGARLLRALLDQFNNQLELTLAAYNAGSGRVGQYGHTIPPFPETIQFVPAVLAHYARNRSDLRLAQQP